jgi:hypothetical protein
VIRTSVHARAILDELAEERVRLGEGERERDDRADKRNYLLIPSYPTSLSCTRVFKSYSTAAVGFGLVDLGVHAVRCALRSSVGAAFSAHIVAILFRVSRLADAM